MAARVSLLSLSCFLWEEGYEGDIRAGEIRSPILWTVEAQLPMSVSQNRNQGATSVPQLQQHVWCRGATVGAQLDLDGLNGHLQGA